MSFSISDFGFTKSGVKVKLYTLTNQNGVSASFTDFGAIWVTMLVPDKNKQMDDVVLGYDTIEKYELNLPHFGATIGRYANRIARGKFTLEGKKYQLEINNETNSLHSGPDYWHLRVWESRVFEDRLGSKVEFKLHSPSGDQGFDGNADVTVSYTLTQQNEIIIDYEMTSDETTPCNLTNHSYFNLAGHKSQNILNQEVWMDADYFLPADLYSIPTGELEPVAGTPMDFTMMTRIGEGIDSDYDCIVQGEGYDHNFCVNHYDGKIKLVAKARDFESGRTMKVYSDMPGIQFYTGNFLRSEVVGKDGADYVRRSGYCFETQFYPNAINMPEFIQPVLKAGEVFSSHTIYKFMTEFDPDGDEM